MGELIGLIDIDMENLVRRARKGEIGLCLWEKKRKEKKRKEKDQRKKKGLDGRSSI